MLRSSAPQLLRRCNSAFEVQVVKHIRNEFRTYASDSSASEPASFVRIAPLAAVDAHAVADALMENIGAASVVDGIDGAAIEDALPYDAASARVDAYLPEGSGEEFGAEQLIGSIRSTVGSIIGPNRASSLYMDLLSVEKYEWIRRSMELYEPRQLSRSIWCVDATSDEAGRSLQNPTDRSLNALADDAIAVRMEAGLAFGTGEHATTCMCANVLEQYVEELHCAGNVLDLGSGSGILSAAAIKLGAAHVDALDTDPVAVRATTRTASLSGVLHSVNCEQCDADNPHINTQYDVVIANILAPVLLNLAQIIGQHACKPGGLLILSGILKGEQERNVYAAYAPYVSHTHTLHSEGWCTLIARVAS